MQLLRAASKISSASSESYIFLPTRAKSYNFHAINIITGKPEFPRPLGSPFKPKRLSIEKTYNFSASSKLISSFLSLHKAFKSIATHIISGEIDIALFN